MHILCVGQLLSSWSSVICNQAHYVNEVVPSSREDTGTLVSWACIGSAGQPHGLAASPPPQSIINSTIVQTAKAGNAGMKGMKQ